MARKPRAQDADVTILTLETEKRVYAEIAFRLLHHCARHHEMRRADFAFLADMLERNPFHFDPDPIVMKSEAEEAAVGAEGENAISQDRRRDLVRQVARDTLKRFGKSLQTLAPP